MLLAGLLRCERCGAAGTLETAKGGEYRYYGCHKAQNAGTAACPGFRIAEKTLDARVLEYVGRELFTRDRCLALLKNAVEKSGALHERVRDERRALQKQLDDVSKRVARWYDQMEIGEQDLEAVLPRVRVLEVKKKELIQALESLVVVQKPAPHLYTDYAIERFRRCMSDAFVSGEGIARTYLRTLFERVVTDGHNVRLVARGDRALQLMATANGGTETSSSGSEFSVLPATRSYLVVLQEGRPPVEQEPRAARAGPRFTQRPVGERALQPRPSSSCPDPGFVRTRLGHGLFAHSLSSLAGVRQAERKI